MMMTTSLLGLISSTLKAVSVDFLLELTWSELFERFFFEIVSVLQ